MLKQKSIAEQVTQILEGKLREIVASMTVEQIYSDREAFSAKVQEVVGTKIGEMGLELNSKKHYIQGCNCRTDGS